MTPPLPPLLQTRSEIPVPHRWSSRRDNYPRSPALQHHLGHPPRPAPPCHRSSSDRHGKGCSHVRRFVVGLLIRLALPAVAGVTVGQLGSEVLYSCFT